MFSEWFTSRAHEQTVVEKHEEMPENEAEVGSIFDKLLDELGLPENSRKVVGQKSAEKKWKLICSHRRFEGGTDTDERHPWQYVEALDNNPGPQDIVDLRDLIVSNGANWHSTFFDCGGLDAFAMVLQDLNSGVMKEQNTEFFMKEECLQCLRAIMNQQIGLDAVIANSDVIPEIACFFKRGMDVQMCIAVMELLTVACVYSSEGHRLVLNAMDRYKKRYKRTEIVRFFALVQALVVGPEWWRHAQSEVDDVDAQASIMTFINSLINAGTELEDRMEVRNDFVYLALPESARDLQALVARERKEHEMGNHGCLGDDDSEEHELRLWEGFDALEQQLEVFEQAMSIDRTQLVRQSVDLSNPEEIFHAVQQSAAESGTSRDLLSILQHLLVIPHDGGVYATGGDGYSAQLGSKNAGYGVQLWQAVEKQLHTIVTGEEEGCEGEGSDGRDGGDVLCASIERVGVAFLTKRRVEELARRNEELEKKLGGADAMGVTDLHQQLRTRSTELEVSQARVTQLSDLLAQSGSAVPVSGSSASVAGVGSSVSSGNASRKASLEAALSAGKGSGGGGGIGGAKNALAGLFAGKGGGKGGGGGDEKAGGMGGAKNALAGLFAAKGGGGKGGGGEGGMGGAKNALAGLFAAKGGGGKGGGGGGGGGGSAGAAAAPAGALGGVANAMAEQAMVKLQAKNDALEAEVKALQTRLTQGPGEQHSDYIALQSKFTALEAEHHALTTSAKGAEALAQQAAMAAASVGVEGYGAGSAAGAAAPGSSHESGVLSDERGWGVPLLSEDPCPRVPRPGQCGVLPPPPLPPGTVWEQPAMDPATWVPPGLGETNIEVPLFAGMPEPPPLPGGAKVPAPPGRKPGGSKKPEDFVPMPEPKEDKKPTVPMRALFWTKIQDIKIHKTVWNVLSDEDVHLDVDLLELRFCKAVKKDKREQEEEAAKKLQEPEEEKKEKKVMLLEPKRQQNLGIALARYNPSSSSTTLARTHLIPSHPLNPLTPT
jgi:hypothetical protein